MSTTRLLQRLGLCVATAAALTACTTYPEPRPVQASNPTVTYVYRTDAELVQANQNASAFCNQYTTTPRTRTLTNNSDGSRTVVFECVGPTSPTVATGPVAVPATVPPGMRYVYRTDAELVQASQTAASYCQRNGTLPMTSNISTNPDGSRTVTFQCTR